jgi:hypothetical protein
MDPRVYALSRASLAATLLLVGAVGTAQAQRVYDPATTPRAKFVADLAPYPGPSYRAKDFSIIKKGAWYHLFYTRVRRFQPDHWNASVNEATFGHAISLDLETWQSLDTVLTVHPGEWDAHHLWSPTLIQRAGVTWMFYTGVRDSQMSASPGDWIPRSQTIGAAYSTDPLLQTWTRVALPVWQPCTSNGLPGVPWAVCNPSMPRGTADFRDPFVMPPSGAGQPWLLFYTTRWRMDQWNHVVGVASSATGPGGTWADVGALWDLYAPIATSKLESPHIFDHAGRWILFTTGDDGSTGILWNSSLSPATGPWEAQGPISNMLEGKKDEPYQYNLEPEYWFASEAFAEQGPTSRADYFCVVHAYDAPPAYNPPAPGTPEDVSIIEFRQMIWSPNGRFDLAAPNPVRAITAPTKARVGEPFDLVLDVEYGAGRNADLVVVRADDGTPVPNVNVGLPATVVLTANGTQAVRWTPRAFSLALPARLEVRTAGQPMQVVAQLTLESGEGSSDDVPHEMPIARADPGAAQAGNGPPYPEGEVLSVREIGATPLGGSHAVLVTMPEAGSAHVALYDVQGRRVRVLRDETLPRGATIVAWDGRDDAGSAVRRGVYFARVTTAFGRAHTRFLVLQ